MKLTLRNLFWLLLVLACCETASALGPLDVTDNKGFWKHVVVFVAEVENVEYPERGHQILHLEPLLSLAGHVDGSEQKLVRVRCADAFGGNILPKPQKKDVVLVFAIPKEMLSKDSPLVEDADFCIQHVCISFSEDGMPLVVCKSMEQPKILRIAKEVKRTKQRLGLIRSVDQ